MPKGFSEDERVRVEAQLLEVGRELFARQGVRRTNVAELARAAGIGKGSFYLFHPSKEALFLAIADQFDAALKRSLVAELDQLRATGASPEAVLRRYFELHFEAFSRHPMLALLADPGELEALMRKLGPERFAAELEHDASFFAALIGRWQAEGFVDASVDVRAVSALSRAVLALIQGRALIGEDDWDPMIALLIDALAKRLAPGPNRRGRG